MISVRERAVGGKAGTATELAMQKADVIGGAEGQRWRPWGAIQRQLECRAHTEHGEEIRGVRQLEQRGSAL